MYVFVAMNIRDHTRAAEIGLEVEDLVVELDEVPPVARVAGTDVGQTGRAKVDRVHVIRASDVPGREPVRARGAGVQEAVVSRLHLLDQRRLSGRRVLNGAKLQ